ncbi:MAG: glycosyl hydrolase family 28-related protein [Eubacteriales bacterium]|nr:glycosyl hydrolase family 28-related protein [Eubacteriales bacterium]
MRKMTKSIWLKRSGRIFRTICIILFAGIFTLTAGGRHTVTKAAYPGDIYWINVVDKGVDNTGIRDCSDLVQQLLRTYKVLYFPSGNYRFNKGIELGDNRTLEGHTVLDGNDRTATYMFFYNTDGYAIECSGKGGTLKNIRMVGNYSGCGGIHVYDTKGTGFYATLEKLWIFNFTGDGIFIDRMLNVHITSVISRGGKANGIRINASMTRIINCDFYDNEQNGMLFTAGGGSVLDCRIWTNGIAGSEYAGVKFAQNAKAIHLTNASVHENYYSGIIFDGVNVKSNVITSLNLIGNNKALGDGYDIVLDGSNNMVIGTVGQSIKHSDGGYASPIALIKVQPTAKFNDVNLLRDQHYNDSNQLSQQFLDKALLTRRIVMNEHNNPMNHIVVNGLEYNAGPPIIRGFGDAAFTEFEEHGVIGHSYENDILNVSLAANDTLPVPPKFSIDAIGKTGIKATIRNGFQEVPISNAYIEFEAKMERFENDLGVCFNGNLWDGTTAYWFTGDYKANGILMNEDWTQVKIPVNLATPIIAKQMDLVLLFVTNTEGTAANRAGNSVEIRNFRLTVNTEN